MLDIKELKKKADVVGIIRSRIDLKQVSGRYVACCPFHGEKTPSFNLDDRQGEWLWKCFGCNKGGDVLTFIELFDHVDSKKAIEKLAELAGSNAQFHAQAKKVSETFKPLKGDEKTKKTIPLDQWIPKEVALHTNAAAMKYLTETRGLTVEIIKQMHLSYNEERNGISGGLVSFPRIDDGKIHAVKYRSIKEKKFTQIEGMASQALFNIETINPLEPVFVTEGEIDACIFEQCGFRAVSLMSASTLPDTEGKKRLMIAEQVYLAGDNDEQGRTCMMKAPGGEGILS